MAENTLISARLFVFDSLASFHRNLGEATNMQEEGGFVF